ncbi:hypothetical protein HPY86_08295 [candidate division WOR-3 bacterium]|nr:hypothetical protein [candidate division WOR-3 bacterium]
MEGLIGVLKDTALRSQKVAKLLAGYSRLIAEPVRNAYERERLVVEVEKVLDGLAPGEVRDKVRQWLDEEKRQIEAAKEEFKFEFGRQLLAGLEGSGLNVKGQLPFLRCGLFSVRVDFATGKATVFWGPEIELLKGGVKLEPLGLAKLLRSYDESLKKRAIKEPAEFGERLFTAYRRVCVARNVAEGERVFLVDLLGEMVFLMQSDGFRVNPVRERFVEYPRIRFSYDLYLLKRSGVRTVGGKGLRLSVANFDATAEKAKALWVPDNEEGEGTFYSYISFVNG